MAITTNATAITFNDNTIQTTAGKTGTVTSVAAGNGLSGGTITTSGTLAIAAPSAGSVGSYQLLSASRSGGFSPPFDLTYGGSYSGTTFNAVGLLIPGDGTANTYNGSTPSGTWIWLGPTISLASGQTIVALGVRVS